MKKLFVLGAVVLGLMFVGTSWAGDYVWTGGDADITVYIEIYDSTTGAAETGVRSDTAGLDLWYIRARGTQQSLTESDLGSLDASHSDGGMYEVAHGVYRLDLPDAAVAAGAPWCIVGGAATGMAVKTEKVLIVGYDPTDGVRMGLTSLPNAAADAAGGLPISDAGGLDMDAMASSVSDIDTATTVGLEGY